jgi:hypothetical protein
MKICSYVKVFVIFACLFGFASLSWSDNTVPAAQDAQGVVGEEAIIAKIDNGKVTLQSSSDGSKVITVSLNDTASLKVGDKVKVQGNSVSKIDAMPGSTDQPAQDPKL